MDAMLRKSGTVLTVLARQAKGVRDVVNNLRIQAA